MAYTEGDGVWRTIRGRRVFLENSKSLYASTVRSGKFPEMKRPGGNDKEESGHIEITNKAISSVPRLPSFLLNEELQGKLKTEHQRLLRRAQGLPPKTEVAQCCDPKNLFSLSGIIEGEAGAGRVKIPDCNKPYIAMHTHPDGRTFSETDVQLFIRYPNQVISSAVGHNGKVYILEKSKNFNAPAAKAFLANAIAQSPDRGKSAEAYIEFIEKAIKGLEEYGVFYYKG